jgi:hypothetical protein
MVEKKKKRSEANLKREKAASQWLYIGFAIAFVIMFVIWAFILNWLLGPAIENVYLDVTYGP